jgi:hypothetical protein
MALVSLVGMLVEDIKDRAKSFTLVSFIHVKRSLNEAAHVLAKFCISITSSEIFHSGLYPGNSVY